MAHLDKQLSQEIKQHQTETRQIKIVITQLVKQKKELENELKNINKNKINTKLPVPSATTKPPPLSSPNLKKPNSLNTKSNIKYTNNIITKEVLTLKTPVFIKFNQI
jgi:hypothetical protein